MRQLLMKKSAHRQRKARIKIIIKGIKENYKLFILIILLGFLSIVYITFSYRQPHEVLKIPSPSQPIVIHPGYYYSNLLKIVIQVPEFYEGKEDYGIITLENTQRKGKIVIEREYTKYSSLEGALNNSNNKLIKNAKRYKWSSLDKQINGSSLEISNDGYAKIYFFYKDNYIYSIFVNSPALLPDFFDVTESVQYSYVPITPTPNLRKVYDFEKILKEQFFVFENKELGFSIQYPPEMSQEVILYSEKQAVFSLISQTTEGTEVYDGLLMKISSYNNDKNSFDHILDEYNTYYNNDFDRRKIEKLVIAGNKTWKVTQCCYAGESNIYFVLDKKKNKYLRIEVYPMGSDKEEYLKIINRMLETIKFIE